jgi:SpoVK/Ycf46/Vps4 family AAA+-type ATPase
MDKADLSLNRLSEQRMPQVTSDTEQGITQQHPGYGTNLEHLSSEMKRLDLLIHLEVLKQRNEQPATPLDQFRGLVMTDEEIERLLNDAGATFQNENPISADDAKARLLTESLSHLESEILRRRAAALKNGIYLSLPHLSTLFHLTYFEEQCMMICLAPEMDRKYEKLYAYLQDDITRKRPSVDLLLSLLCDTTEEKLAARLAFDTQAPLQKYRLLRVIESSPDYPAPLISRSLKLDDRVVNFLLGFRLVDGQLDHVARLVSSQADAETLTLDEAILNRILKLVRQRFDESNPEIQNIVFYFCGPYGSGKHSLAKAVCRDIGLPMIVCDVSKMLTAQTPFEEITWLLGREAALQPAALCLENFDCLMAGDDNHHSQLKSLLESVSALSRLTFLLGSQPWKPQGFLKRDFFIRIDFPLPDDKTRKRIWESHLDSYSRLAGDADLGALASKFRFTPGQIRDALDTAQNLARWRSPDDAQVTEEDLYVACRAQSNLKLGELARKIEPRYTWADLVLPSDQMEHLAEICNQVKHRSTVYGEWGFDRKLSLGKGLNALFSGPPGTGKTLAAEIIANELRLDLYKIDLSQVVSKYIGETEKNLHRIFREAQASNTILLFDEADALFGKRSEVKDAHDRYANIEIGYLLQKMEEYEGITILATNLRQNMDEAFVRRMHSIVEFPFPDEQHRRRIWEVIYPPEAPLGDDADFAILAREIKLAGGNIKNIALRAAFYAAKDGGIIRMPHLARAARREYQKLGRTWDEGERKPQNVFVS